ncbi:class I tRNA ligase family protein, partial [Yoonia sp.]|uniref:class I tRNA ligase family protein n=1 Tax=Yoonia sp. TaxID=2212373 RepID=UPI002397C259
TEITETVPFVEAKKIMQPFGDRSKVVIEPALTDQWFVDTDKIVGPALDAVKNGDVTIMPESGEKVFYHWLENIEPWCISRQLWWGHQIPVWYGPAKTEDGTGIKIGSMKPFCAANFLAVKNLAEKYYGNSIDVVEADGELDEDSTSREDDAFERYFEAWPTQDGDPELTISLRRDPDVLDTWFSSGLWPFGTLGWPEQTDELAKYFPGDVLITGQDILFFWVARMMMMAQAVEGENPFHTVYLHQLVRDEKGEKMSKTKGNVVDPLVVVDEFGADALRFTMAQMAAIGGVLKLSQDRIKGYRNFGTKLWNAFSFAEHYEIPNPGDTAMPVVTQTLNKWIIGETAKVRETVDAALTDYRFNDAANALYAFTWGQVCDWYLEFSKPILQGTDEAAKAETQATLRWVLDQCLILLHPIKPFITEELWGLADTRAKMLIHADWPTYTSADLVDTDADREMSWVINLIDSVRSNRAQVHVPAGAKVPLLVQNLDAKGQSAWDNNHVLIQRLARVESLTSVEAFPKGCVTIPMDGGTFGIPLEGLIDVAEETARLEKTLGKLGKELGGLRGRLKNPKFVASAPPEVIAETRENLRLREDEESQLKAAIARLSELG